jgi:hypothetical protein
VYVPTGAAALILAAPFAPIVIHDAPLNFDHDPAGVVGFAVGNTCEPKLFAVPDTPLNDVVPIAFIVGAVQQEAAER